MRDTVHQLLAALDQQRPVAYCRLVETRGSTPQKPGALMLVFADGSQAGTLGGGCVEAEVKRRALAALTEGNAVVEKFQLDHDYGWDDGLICGGRMQILIQPLLTPAARAYAGRLAHAVRDGEGVTEAVVFDAAASGLAAPLCVLFAESGKVLALLHAAATNGARGAGAGARADEAPALLKAGLRPLVDRPRPYNAQGVAYLPALPRCRLLIVGAGHVGKAVGDLAAELDFDVWIVDDREDYASPERFPRAERRIVGSISEVLPRIEITRDTYCLIVTRGHNHDEEALLHLAERGARYVGLIGSRRKIKLIFEDLLDQGISAEALTRVYAPLGIDIGSQTVPEIAVSICAELVAHRNRGGVVPGRPSGVELPPAANQGAASA